MKALSLHPHPFRLLLSLEWILLGLAAFKLFGFPGWGRPVLWSEAGWFTTIAVNPQEVLTLTGLLLVFGLMGLRLPTGRWAKWLYLLIAFTLLAILAHLQGWGLDSLSPLLIVMLLRSSLMFQQVGRWVMASLIWLVYPMTLAPFLLALWVILRFSAIRDWDVSRVPGMLIRPDGGIELNWNFSPEQVQQFFAYLQNAILYFLSDSLLSFGLILVFVLLLVNSLVNERQGRRKLVLAHEQLYHYSLQVEDQAILQERTRIAREIHDSLGHLLTAQNVMLQNAVLSLKSGTSDVESFLVESQQLGSTALQELRQAILMLRSDPMQGKSFEQAIAGLIESLHRTAGIQPIVQMNLPILPPGRVQVAVYRILEEALTNIQKHSSATEVAISLVTQPHHSKTRSILTLEVTDNGHGFDFQQNRTGFGLQGMQERASSLGGSIRFETQSQKGCRVIATFPFSEETV